jgi:putative endonuclease
MEREGKQKFGDEGEEEALRYLLEQNYSLLAAKFSTRWGEIDLVMRHKEIVKHRRNDHFGQPEEAVTKTKQAHLAKAALVFIQNRRLQNKMIRFDVVSIGPLGLRHYPDAFSAGYDFYY